jgi:hypothetical protein
MQSSPWHQMKVTDQLCALTVYLTVTRGKSFQFLMDMGLGIPQGQSGLQVLTDK